MPLAFDFTSTLVIGSTLPVATTLLAKSPRSTLASFEGSILVLPCAIAATNADRDQHNYDQSDDRHKSSTLRRFFLTVTVHNFLLRSPDGCSQPSDE